jgi:hypothetical protein
VTPGEFQQRARKALGVIDERKETPTTVRSCISGVYPLFGPKVDLSNSPRSAKLHPLHPENAAEGEGKWEVFVQTLNALLRQYRAYSKLNLQKDAPALLRIAEANVELQVARLEALAKKSAASWVIMGSVREGFWLV